MKLMDIDSDQLGIPDTEYDARVTMPAAEFTRIVRDLSLLGESVRIEVSKEGIRFTSEGEAANGNVLLKQTDGKVGKVQARSDPDGDEEEAEGSTQKVKREKDDDVEMDEEQEQEFQPNSDDEGEDEQEPDDDDESGKNKKRKKKVCDIPRSFFSCRLTPLPKANGSSKPSKKAKTKKSENDDQDGVVIEMNQHVSLTFSLKYLVNFSKSASLSPKVQLMMSNDVPLLVRVSPPATV
jgi:proliferating cell nuclear antigen